MHVAQSSRCVFHSENTNKLALETQMSK
jgi:hypothetical protein